MTEISSYADAVYHVKRGFMIFGVTGYTGSGCTTVQRILARPTKPKMPDFETLVSSGESNIDHRRYRKLKRAWEGLAWQQFVPIEVSIVIFALAVYRALNSRRKHPTLGTIRRIVGPSKRQLNALRYLRGDRKLTPSTAKKLVEAYKSCRRSYDLFKRRSTRNIEEFIELMQNLGDEIRRYGMVCPRMPLNPEPRNLFVLPEALRRLIRAYRTADDVSHFVIDAFRNPYEAEFFRRRYEEFYLIGVLRNEIDRQRSLSKNLSPEGLNRLERRERGSAIVRKRDNISEWVTSQNIEEILQKADVFIKNIPDHGKSYPHLRFNLTKLISLAKNPGCVTPTVDERSMQIAMTARQMSGCISRQVGAVLVDDKDYVLGIGWNDPPEGQIPCALRTGKELVDGPPNGAFSEYEKCNDFVSHMREKYYVELPFCFQSELSSLSGEQGDKLAEHTRALHAEENALFQAVRNAKGSIEGAILYTTASPCTLCAKKAYQLGVKRIVYIEEYPGIAIDQTLRTGAKSVEVTQFEGVTGSAYFRFFSSLMPEKDLIQLYIL